MGAYTIAFEGWPRNPGQFGRGGVDRCLLEPRLFGSLVGAGVYRVAGFGLVQGRVAAVIFAIVLVLAVYGTMRGLFGPIVAAAASVLTAIDPWFFIIGRTFREDVFAAALIWLAFGLMLREVNKSPPGLSTMLGGLCLGLAVWAHPNAIVLAVGGLIALVVTRGPRILGRRWFAYAVLGAAIGLLPYVVFVTYVQATTGLSLLNQVGQRVGAWQRPSSDILTCEALRWSGFLRLPTRLPLLLIYLWAIAWTVWRGKRNDRLLLVFIFSTALLLPAMHCVPTMRYVTALIPALAALVWRSLSDGFADVPLRCPPSLWRRVRRGVLGVYLAMAVVPTLSICYAHRQADYPNWSARVVASIPTSAKVMGHTMFWTALCDYNFVSEIAGDRGEWPDERAARNHLERLRPDYVIESSWDCGALGGFGPRPANFRRTPMSRAIEQVAAEHSARMLTEFYDRDFGAVRVWRFEWAEPGGGSAPRSTARRSSFAPRETGRRLRSRRMTRS